MLKEKYNVLSTEELCQLLNRTDKAIYHQVSYLRKRGWTFHRKKDENS